MTTAINTGYYNNPYQQNYQNWLSSPYNYQNTGVNNIAFTSNPTQQQVTQKKDDVADGKDDGKIGFWKATGNFLKGAWDFIKSPFTDDEGNFSLWETFKSVAIGAAIVATGGTALALTAGLALGAFGMAKSAVNIATAETDAECEAAWRSMGSSTTGTAAALIGCKKYGALKNPDGTGGYLSGVKTTYGDAKATVTNGIRALGEESLGSLYEKGTAKMVQAKEAVVNKYNTYKAMTPEERAALRTSTTETVNESLGGIKDVKFKDLGQKVLALGRRAKEGASSMSLERQTQAFGTYALAGRYTTRPDFYSQLSPAEKQYFDSLPAEQKQALINQYNAA